MTKLSKEIFCHSPDEMLYVAKTFAPFIQNGQIFGLNGEMGSGKTVFVTGIASGLHIRPPQQVSSPTFALVNIYNTDLVVYHFDLYRIKSFPELCQMGFEDYIEQKAVFFIEWAGKFSSSFSCNIEIFFQHQEENTRALRFGAPDKKAQTLIDDFLEKLLYNSEYPFQKETSQ